MLVVVLADRGKDHALHFFQDEFALTNGTQKEKQKTTDAMYDNEDGGENNFELDYVTDGGTDTTYHTMGTSFSGSD